MFFAVPVWDVKKNFSPELILSIKPRMHISPWSWAVGKLKKIWIQTYFGPLTVDSVEIPSLRHFAFCRQGNRLVSQPILTLLSLCLRARNISLSRTYRATSPTATEFTIKINSKKQGCWSECGICLISYEQYL